MAARLQTLAGRDFAADARAVSAPTLVVTGEPALDRVVAVEGTREYVKLIPHAVGATLERTGHLGLVTRPAAFAEIVYDWSRQSAGPVG
jgi:pimeloyl-ACP methyl ester carboxylesterase